MLKTYAIFLPSVAGNVENEWEQIRKQLTTFTLEGNRFLKLNIFVNLPDYKSLIRTREFMGKSINEAFGSSCPAFSVTAHPPESPWKVAVESLSVSAEMPGVQTKYLDSVPYVVISAGNCKEVWGAGLCSDLWPDDTRQSASAAFESIVGILEKEGMSMNSLVRQWNYIGNILQIRNGYQNYQTFNEVRNEYYQKYRTIPGYPAATGIGMMHGGVVLDFLAIHQDKSLKVRPVENPNQINAYEYDQKVLKGSKEKGQPLKHAPQFERALMVINKKSTSLLISGTASIIGQKTIGKGDVREQTIVTIENIKKLIDPESISQLAGSDFGSCGRFSLIRVYVKHSKDFEDVRKICSEHYPGVPAVYIIADICRDDLLVEIEAEFLP
jgi:enamine deaminase RidA (YjgF/YER057c/UK114 family)